MDESLMKISDAELYSRCKRFGEIALKYRWKFAGLLPEVNRRRLYKKKGCESIFEFAAKLAGMSEEQVRRVLNLERKFEEMPILKNMLVGGNVSFNKLAKVASIATPENQEILANQVKLLSCRALEILSKDVHVNTHPSQNPQNTSGSGVGNGAEELKLNSEVTQKLLELQRKGIDLNKLLFETRNFSRRSVASTILLRIPSIYSFGNFGRIPVHSSKDLAACAKNMRSPVMILQPARLASRRNCVMRGR